VNALDLNKIAKAFGFKVPPRVNLAIGPGKGQSARAGEKRRRDETESESEDENAMDVDPAVTKVAPNGSVRGPMRGKDGKAKRMETLGKRSVDKEMFRKGKEMKALGKNWSR